MFHIRTIKARLHWYNLCIICIIAVIFSVSSYLTTSRKTVEVAEQFPELPCGKYYIPLSDGLQ